LLQSEHTAKIITKNDVGVAYHTPQTP